MSTTQVTIPKRLIASVVLGLAALVIAIAIGGNSYENVKTGEYKVVTQWFTGKMFAKMSPGFMWQFGDQNTMPKSETFFFTAGKYEGESYDQSIPIVFADLSGCDASGTMRIDLPTSESQAIALMRDQNYVTYKDVEQKLVLPVVRKALNATAKLMTARESAGERYNEFIAHAVYQIDNGLYITESVDRKVVDPLSGEEVTVRFQEIQYDDSGNPLVQQNPLEGTGIRVANFEIEKFKYDDVVVAQIAQQQAAVMAVATKKLEAQEAEQEKIKITALGKAAVEKARYEMEEVKIREVTEAEKLKAVAELKAEQDYQVAILAKKAAAETKAKDILLGEGEAKRKALVMQADGALKQKLDAYIEVQKNWATAVQNYTGNWVPSTVMGSNGSTTGGGAQTLVDLLTAKTAKDLQLDLDVKAANK